MKIVKYIFLVLVLVLTLSVIIPLVQHGVYTTKHLEEFDGLYNEYTESPEWSRVVKYTPVYAEVYSVGYERYAGFLSSFYKKDGKWEAGGFVCVWSKRGSADERIWPYIFRY